MPELHDAPDFSKQRAEDIEKSFHFTSMIITILVIISLFLNIRCNFTSQSESEFCEEYHAYLIAFFIITFIGYLIECFCSGSRKYLTHDLGIIEYEKYLKHLRAQPPYIGTKIECYHYTRPEGENEEFYDSEGKQRTRPQKYHDREVTYKGISYFHYKSWEDTTGEIEGDLEGGLVKLEVRYDYEFANDYSQKKFEDHRDEYIKKNRNRDQYVDDFLLFEIPGHKGNVLVHTGDAEPYCLSINWFWFWSFLLLSWPYRFWFEMITNNKHIMITKTIHAHPSEEKPL